MKAATFKSSDIADTHRIAAALALALPENAGAVVTLDGPLGAGKTHFVQGVAQALDFDPKNVTSPTFVLVNEYPAVRPIYHFDAYRVKDDDEFLELGAQEYFQSPGISLVEWASRVKECLPREFLQIEITVESENARDFRLQAQGQFYKQLLDSVAATVKLSSA
ncbi:MAG: tRNA (adenosine(37)-N6)-threonylcarbamoyltransferase complex ATPase subunit type 1 TsaE [Pirellulales bacterium]|nr:tRNA (adenosine(37)-N6)-threonylcarbamoyltransferase complex ATPase subunit type 1 TsaE [Pirellulales bacterium]